MGDIGSGTIHKPIICALDWTTFAPVASSSTTTETSHILIEPNMAPAEEKRYSVVCSRSFTIEGSMPYDYILMTDCVFSVVLVPYLIRTLLKLSSVHTQLFCCHEIRDEVINPNEIYFVIELLFICLLDFLHTKLFPHDMCVYCKGCQP